MKRVIYVHFNKQSSKNGLPWTVHVSGQCLLASGVTINTPVETVWKPLKKANPRAFMKTKGVLRFNGTHITIG